MKHTMTYDMDIEIVDTAAPRSTSTKSSSIASYSERYETVDSEMLELIQGMETEMEDSDNYLSRILFESVDYPTQWFNSEFSEFDIY